MDAKVSPSTGYLRGSGGIEGKERKTRFLLVVGWRMGKISPRKMGSLEQLEVKATAKQLWVRCRYTKAGEGGEYTKGENRGGFGSSGAKERGLGEGRFPKGGDGGGFR